MDENNSENSNKYSHDNKLGVTMIPFTFRKSPILSIIFRSLDLEMGQFRLKIESDTEQTPKIEIFSNLTEMTLVRNTIRLFFFNIQVPKFQFDYKNKDINYLNTTTYPKYILSLLDKENNEKLKFNLNLLNLSFLGEELYTTSIYYYPILIIEFMNGYYTSNELYQKNYSLINNQINEKISKDSSSDNLIIVDFPEKTKSEEINSQRKSSVFIPEISVRKNLDLKLEEKDGSSNNENNSDKKETGRSSSYSETKDLEITKNKEKNKNKAIKSKMKSEVIELKEKRPNCYKFVNYFDIYLEKIIYFRDKYNKKNDSNEINIKIDTCENIIEAFKRKERILTIKKQIEYYKNKSEEIKKIKEKLKTIILNKKTILTNLNQKINSYREQCSKLEEENKQTYPLVIHDQMIYNSFLNKRMVEICFFFFNKKIKNLYFIPEFLQINIKNDNESIKNRFTYYNDNKKRISSMMGYIAQFMIYMSKCFDIPMPYPLCLMAAKSFVVRGKKDKDKDFLPLHCDLKRDDKYGNFETGLSYLKKDFNEIINFCSMFPQIISENEYNKIYNNKEENAFFYFFINFNHCLLQFIKNVQKMFE